MKIFVQAKNEALVINDEITVTAVDIRDEEVVLAVDAPEWVKVCETETLKGSEFAPVRPR